MFALVDCTSFYASCEKVFRPDLKDKPVIVLSNNDGCVVARCPVAKAMDIPAWQPYFKIKDELEAKGVHVFSSNYALYQNISDRVMSILSDIAPNIEIYSIDEAFLGLHGLNSHQLYETAKIALERPHKWTGIPVGVGIAKTKTLAKVANHIAKKIDKTGICIIESRAQHIRALKKVHISDVWGVGRRSTTKLEAMGINTAFELACYDIDAIHRCFNVNMARTVLELRGTPCFGLEEVPEPRQQIVCSRMFGKKQTRFEPIAEALAEYIAKACERLRSGNQYASAISVHLMTSRYTDKAYSKASYSELSAPSNDTREFIKVANKQLEQLYTQGYKFSKVGVTLSRLCDGKNRQLGLFSNEQTQRSEKLMQTMDAINNKGLGRIHLAAQGMSQQWKMNRNMMSPSYVSKWTDLPIVN